MSSSDELAKKKAKLAELRKAKEARLAAAPLGVTQVLNFVLLAFTIFATVLRDQLEMAGFAFSRRVAGILTGCSFNKTKSISCRERWTKFQG